MTSPSSVTPSAVTLGRSGLVVSRVGLGCNNLGRPGAATESQEGSDRVVGAALDAGITLFDVADTYGATPGLAEERLGRSLGARRPDVIVATKFGMDMGGINGPDFGARGSRRYIRTAVEASLRRLGTDWIDLYQFHTPDPRTPIEETMSALDDLVRAGKVRYLGHSNRSGWQIAQAAYVARELGVERFVSAQNHYNLTDRRAELEVLPAARELGLGVLPYFPLANGLLTGKYASGSAPEGTRLARTRRHLLTKPVSDVVLIARVRSLTRLKMMTDELRMRALTSMEIGVQAPERSAVLETGIGGRILLVDDRPSSYERLAPVLAAEHSVDVEPNPSEALFHAAEGNYDLLIVSLGLENFDGLRLCSQARSLERTRQVPILAIADADNNARLLRGLEIGVNDYLLRPVDKNELLARARTQIRRRRYTDHLRDNVQNSIEMAITDGLTGLHNRRYMETHLETLAEQASHRGKALALMMLDIDFFKAVNDTYGHDAGDDVLREFAVRIRKSIRGIDLACRYGGEEFVIVMPETDMHVAGMVAERLRRAVAAEPFAIDKGSRHIEVTISIGLAGLERKGEPMADVLKRADLALYRAKHDGRNRVVAAAA